MGDIKKIISNSGWIIGCKLIKAVLTLIITMIISRYFGPSNFGLINYASSLVTFVTPIMKLGIDSIIVYELINNEEEQGKILGTTIILNAIMSFICIVSIILFVLLMNPGEFDTLIVCGLYSIVLIFEAFEMIQYWFQAKLISKFCSIAMILSYIVVSAFQIILLLLKLDIYWFAISSSIDYFLISLFLILIYKFKFKGTFSFSTATAKKLFNKSKYYIVSSLMVTIFAQTDKVMIKIIVDNAAVGYYSAAVTAASMLSFVFAAIIDSARPSIFEASKNSKKEFEKKLKYLYSIIIYFSLFTSLFICFLSPVIVNVLYGKSYLLSINILRVIVWYTTFSYIGTVRNIWILANNKQKYLWIINLSGAILNIVLNLIFINAFGIIGAAIASVLTQIFTNFILGFILKPIYNNNKILIEAIKLSNIKSMFNVFYKNLKRSKKNDNC